MLPADAHKAIKILFETAWPTASGGVPFVLDNDAADQSPTYARLNLQPMPNERRTLGGEHKSYTRRGLARVKLNVPPDQGDDYSLTLVAAVKSIFEDVRTGPGDDGVVFYETSWRAVGSDGQYFTVLVDTPFSYTETK